MAQPTTLQLRNGESLVYDPFDLFFIILKCEGHLCEPPSFALAVVAHMMHQVQ